MRKRGLMAGMLLMWLATIPAVAARETRDGVLPGATVKITNTGTNVSQPLLTNASGSFEAPLLIAGEYDVSVEFPNFKSFRQTAKGAHL